jgi:hypothetical protein
MDDDAPLSWHLSERTKWIVGCALHTKENRDTYDEFEITRHALKRGSTLRWERRSGLAVAVLERSARRPQLTG